MEENSYSLDDVIDLLEKIKKEEPVELNLCMALSCMVKEIQLLKTSASE